MKKEVDKGGGQRGKKRSSKRKTSVDFHEIATLEGDTGDERYN